MKVKEWSVSFLPHWQKRQSTRQICQRSLPLALPRVASPGPTSGDALKIIVLLPQASKWFSKFILWILWRTNVLAIPTFSLGRQFPELPPKKFQVVSISQQIRRAHPCRIRHNLDKQQMNTLSGNLYLNKTPKPGKKFPSSLHFRWFVGECFQGFLMPSKLSGCCKEIPLHKPLVIYLSTAFELLPPAMKRGGKRSWGNYQCKIEIDFSSQSSGR